MPTIKSWLDAATKELSDIGITSARLDAEIILAHTVRKPRTYLHAHEEQALEPREIEIADARLLVRLDRVPVAYIIGHKEFYGRRFTVTPSTLTPRPETEDMIDVVKKLVPKNISLFDESFRIVDVGTGTGCIGITLKLEIPDAEVTLLDIDPYVLKVAASNASRLQADVQSIKSNLLQNYPFRSNIIVANLPYVDPSWERSPETHHEPEQALFAADGGLALIKKLIDQAATHIAPSGFMVLEADPTQHADIIQYGIKKDFRLESAPKNYILSLQKNAA
jgi:release factor glutamine methyltransferase